MSTGTLNGKTEIGRLDRGNDQVDRVERTSERERERANERDSQWPARSGSTREKEKPPMAAG